MQRRRIKGQKYFCTVIFHYIHVRFICNSLNNTFPKALNFYCSNKKFTDCLDAQCIDI